MTERREVVEARATTTQVTVTEALSTLALANIADLTRLNEDGQPEVDFSRATREQMYAVQSVKTKTRRMYNSKGEHIATERESGFTLTDRLKPLELLGRQLGMFKTDDVKVTIDIADRLLSARKRVLALPAPDAED